jgi:hypothetical protein
MHLVMERSTLLYFLFLCLIKTLLSPQNPLVHLPINPPTDILPQKSFVFGKNLPGLANLADLARNVEGQLYKKLRLA